VAKTWLTLCGNNLADRKIRWPRRRLLACFVLIMFGVVFAGSASALRLADDGGPLRPTNLMGTDVAATTINVPADQPTLQAAVAAASSGDLILLAPGTYQGGVWVQDKALTIASWHYTTSDPTYIEQTVVSGYGPDVCGGAPGCFGNAVLEFGTGAGGSTVTGLTISSGVDGVRASSRVDISHSRLIGNGDGTDYENGSGTFSDNLFASNSDDGIDLNNDVDLRIVDNTVRDNGDDGIELRMHPYSGPVLKVDVVRNRFIHNDEDGIQLIDSPGASSRVIRIERNVFHRKPYGRHWLHAGPTDG
jgi:hypothetical protein